MATPEKPGKVGISMDEFMDQVRIMFERDVRFVLINPHDAIALAKAMTATAIKILTTPPKGVTPN